MSKTQQDAIRKIVKGMKRTGNRPGIVQQWVNGALEWAEANPGSEAKSVQDWVAYWQIRPFYTAIELVPLVPALGVAFKITDHPLPQFSAKRLANMLDFAGLPKLRNANGTTYFQHPYRREPEEFYIVEQIHFWKDRKLTQEIFNDLFRR